MSNERMKIAETRRENLRELIRRRFDGVARQLALAASKPEGQINDMLSSPPRKSFGEKVARQIESSLGLDPLFFDKPPVESPTYSSAESTKSGHRVSENIPNVAQFPDKQLLHPSVEEVIRLMVSTDDVGKGMMLARVRDIAEERARLTSKPKLSR